MDETTRVCPSCGRPASVFDVACATCGRELPFAAIHPEPFTVYPPPFSEPAPPERVAVPPVPPVVEPPPATDPEPEPVAIGQEPEPVAILPEPVPLSLPPVLPDAPEETAHVVQHPEHPAPVEPDRSHLTVPGLIAGDQAELLELIRSGRRGEAFRFLGERTSLDVTQAARMLDVLESLLKSGFAPEDTGSRPVFQAPGSSQVTVTPTREVASASALLAGLNLPQDVFATIYGLTRQNMRIQAIRLLRQHSGLSLAEAKDRIDRLALLVGARQTQCFIATACYGSSSHPDVETLRRYRDERLMLHACGRAFVRAYYAVSPGIARCLGRNAGVAGTVRRRVLEPLVRRLRAD